MRRLLALALAVALWPALGAAQTATLVADSLAIRQDRTLVAEGDVEVIYEDTRLTAERIVFDQATDRLAIEGPIAVVEAGGEALLLADQAALSRDLQAGILRSARLVLDEQLQLAAAQVVRAEGRYTRLSNVVASSCRVCPSSPTPLWEIRAARVVHDRLDRQIYFDRAQFRLAGLPVAYIPRLRLPDPSVERATGLLTPSLRFSSELGPGVKLPYFIVLGQSADLTLTPYIADRTRTLEFRYRQAFRRGTISVYGAASDDELGQDGRSFLFAEGDFVLPADFLLSFGVETASDDDYLLEYGYSDDTRLETEVEIVRARRDELIRTAITEYETLREGSLPGRDERLETYARALYERRVPLRRAGELRFSLDAAGLRRGSDLDRAGRDVARIGAGVGWRGDRVLANGLVLDGVVRFGVDAYGISNDARFDETVTRVVPRSAIALRWPLVRTRGAVAEALQPVVQLGWAEVYGGDVPNEDSRLVELDEGNLFALGRFPGRDRAEDGSRIDLGLSYTRTAPGSRLGLVAGRVVRFGGGDQFEEGTGLAGGTSDWLTAVHLDLGDRLALANRALLRDDLDVSRNEFRVAYDGERAEIAASHIWIDTDPLRVSGGDVNELTLDAGYRISRSWSGEVEGRYSLETDRADSTGIGLSWRNECLRIDVSLSRRYTSSTNVEPITDFGLEVSLLGFGAGDGDQRFRQTCPG